MEPPAEYKCPITMELMVDPVLCEDGHTYERKTILEWLARSQTSPLTRQPLNPNALHPNHALKSAIQAWKMQKNMYSAPVVVYPPQAYQTPTYQTPSYNPPSYYPNLPYQFQPQPPTPISYPYQTQTATVVVSQPSSDIALQMQRQRKIKVIALGICLFLFILILSSILSIKSDTHTNDDD